LKTDNSLHAIKAIRKDLLLQLDQIPEAIQERDIMLECEHPFLIGLNYVF